MLFMFFRNIVDFCMNCLKMAISFFKAKIPSNELHLLCFSPCAEHNGTLSITQHPESRPSVPEHPGVSAKLKQALGALGHKGQRTEISSMKLKD